ncbi:hypothetical protein M231_05557 [Tremella mesenterica]|uniref:Myb-like domain-containing protein n=1 Tax=Tremella mesenterica TaxID=5217 RepID=A0A4Q1BHT6_TREME|nr:hypothetical protein M231_05557 [Tremella mesenterica]
MAPVTPVKREASNSSELDIKPPTPSPKKAKKSPRKSVMEGDKKMGAWSGEELKMLYEIMCPKKMGWTRMQDKIKKAIEDMGE